MAVIIQQFRSITVRYLATRKEVSPPINYFNCTSVQINNSNQLSWFHTSQAKKKRWLCRRLMTKSRTEFGWNFSYPRNAATMTTNPSQSCFLFSLTLGPLLRSNLPPALAAQRVSTLLKRPRARVLGSLTRESPKLPAPKPQVFFKCAPTSWEEWGFGLRRCLWSRFSSRIAGSRLSRMFNPLTGRHGSAAQSARGPHFRGDESCTAQSETSRERWMIWPLKFSICFGVFSCVCWVSSGWCQQAHERGGRYFSVVWVLQEEVARAFLARQEGKNVWCKIVSSRTTPLRWYVEPTRGRQQLKGQRGCEKKLKLLVPHRPWVLGWVCVCLCTC